MSKELVISSNRHETKVAILEEDQLVEIYFQRSDEYSLAGSVHKGRVTRVLPGMQSAFVDLGLERDTFLYVSDFLDETEEYDAIPIAKEDRQGRSDRSNRNDRRPDRNERPERSERPDLGDGAEKAPVEAAVSQPVDSPIAPLASHRKQWKRSRWTVHRQADGPSMLPVVSGPTTISVAGVRAVAGIGAADFPIQNMLPILVCPGR